MADTPRKPTAREAARARRRARDASENEGRAGRAAASDDVLALFPDDGGAKRKRRGRESVVPEPGRKIQDPRPGGTRVQVGKRWTEVKARIEAGEYTWDEFVSELEPEELARGQLHDKDGGWRGRPPQWVPRAFFTACQRELKRRFDEKLQERVLSAVDEYVGLSRTTPDDNTREKMLRYLMERVFGPIPKEVVVTAEKPWEGAFSKILRPAPEEKGESRYANRDKPAPEDDGGDEHGQG